MRTPTVATSAARGGHNFRRADRDRVDAGVGEHGVSDRLRECLEKREMATLDEIAHGCDDRPVVDGRSEIIR